MAEGLTFFLKKYYIASLFLYDSSLFFSFFTISFVVLQPKKKLSLKKYFLLKKICFALCFLSFVLALGSKAEKSDHKQRSKEIIDLQINPHIGRDGLPFFHDLLARHNFSVPPVRVPSSNFGASLFLCFSVSKYYFIRFKACLTNFLLYYFRHYFHFKRYLKYRILII